MKAINNRQKRVVVARGERKEISWNKAGFKKGETVQQRKYRIHESESRRSKQQS